MLPGDSLKVSIVAWNHPKVDLEIVGCIQQFISHGNLLHLDVDSDVDIFFSGGGGAVRVFKMAR